MISILMAAYNGERYIREQIDSILDQTEQNRILYIRDDGSTDSTPQIIREYGEKYPGMVIPVRDGKGKLGCIRNFLALLAYAQSDYYMFCDQDDIWVPDKVEKTEKAMKNAEKASHGREPVLVHTDLKVVDADGVQTAPSFVEKLGLDAAGSGFAGMIFSNVVTGCTMMINQSMKDKLGDVPVSCMMHDHWIGLLAEGCGRRVFLPEATVLYRQHGSNEMGAKGRSTVDKAKKIINIGGYLGGIKRTAALRERNFRQLEDFYRLYRKQMHPEARKKAAALLNIKRLPGKERVKLLEEGGYLPKDRYEAETIRLYYRFWVK